MALLLLQALLANPLACVCFWLLGLVMGSVMRWWRRTPIQPAGKQLTLEAKAPGLSLAQYGIGPPSASTVSVDGRTTPDPARSTTPTPPNTPPHPQQPQARADAHAQGKHASLPAPRHPWYIHDKDAKRVLARVAAQDQGQERGWSHMMDKHSTEKWTYSAYRRPLPSGLTEYRTITTFADCTPIELMEFLLDDEARRNWEGFLSNVDILSTGDWLGGREQVVRMVRSFPFAFLSDREYVMARKAWVVQEGTGGEPKLMPLTSIYPGAPLVASTKGLDNHPAAPPSRSLIRTSDFSSNWVCRTVPDPWGRGHNAAQVVLLHSEDDRIAEYLARMAVAMGMPKFVKDLTGGLLKFKASRREWVPPHSLDLTAYGHDHPTRKSTDQQGGEADGVANLSVRGPGQEEETAKGQGGGAVGAVRAAVKKAVPSVMVRSGANTPKETGGETGGETGEWAVAAVREGTPGTRTPELPRGQQDGAAAGAAVSSQGGSPYSSAATADADSGRVFASAPATWDGGAGQYTQAEAGGEPSMMAGGFRRGVTRLSPPAARDDANQGESGSRPAWQKALLVLAATGMVVVGVRSMKGSSSGGTAKRQSRRRRAGTGGNGRSSRRASSPRPALVDRDSTVDEDLNFDSSDGDGDIDGRR